MESDALQVTLMEIFLKNSHQIQSTVSKIVQMCLFLIGCLLTALCVFIAIKCSTFHKNLRNIFIALIFVWFELFICRLLVFRFQHILANFDGDIDELDECGRIGNCSLSANWADSIFIAANLRYHYMYFVMFTPIAILSERISATILIHDYEKKRRSWIYVIILIAQTIFSVSFALITTSFRLTFVALIVCTGTIMIAAILIYILVEYINKKRLLKLEQDHRNTNYSLSIRYQLKENLKTLKLMRRFFLSIIGFIVVMALTNSIPVLLKFPESAILSIREYLDYLFHANPIILVPTAILTIESYRRFFLSRTRQLFGIRYESQRNNLNKLKLPANVNESDVYFEIFERQLYSKPSFRQIKSNSTSKLASIS
ncbi:unnamed protein product [Caenorhabditis bovis]|uniref:Uncharacterized protein n=1 Tax=Caenorhabditis bovis TaxID=2654633 RepID=A0A8S1FFQ4_9PELO|nr:unnamed protein product [Caenorhabditis bovis]